MMTDKLITEGRNRRSKEFSKKIYTEMCSMKYNKNLEEKRG